VPRLCLYQPDIPQNAGTLLRLAACLGVPVDVIEPCGFLWDEKRMRRAGMDYLDRVEVIRHHGWEAFRAVRQGRLVLLTTKAEARVDGFAFRPDDVIVMGRESAGVPDEVAAACDVRLTIPMRPGVRSLNVAAAATIALWEALRTTGGLP
jgi:tRNA (cytidine/uridine-2'-O-)-methyltransferase